MTIPIALFMGVYCAWFLRPGRVYGQAGFAQCIVGGGAVHEVDFS